MLITVWVISSAVEITCALAWKVRCAVIMSTSSFVRSTLDCSRAPAWINPRLVLPGAAVVGGPGDPGFATVRQGYLEDSNVDPVKEITDLISAQRGYEMNSKVIQAADEMAAVVSKNIR